jgi:alcohol dehydrogenase (NADP+)
VAEAAGVTPAETVLAWHVARGVVPIPSTTSADHAVSNLAAARCRLEDRAMDRLDGLFDPRFER